MRRPLVLVAALAAATSFHCAAPEPTVTEAAAAAPATDWVPVGGYLGGDQATGDQIFQMLRERGIESVSYGSLGYTVSVPAADAPRARDILRAAIAAKTVAPTVSVHEERDLPRP